MLITFPTETSLFRFVGTYHRGAGEFCGPPVLIPAEVPAGTYSVEIGRNPYNPDTQLASESPGPVQPWLFWGDLGAALPWMVKAAADVFEDRWRAAPPTDVPEIDDRTIDRLIVELDEIATGLSHDDPPEYGLPIHSDGPAGGLRRAVRAWLAMLIGRGPESVSRAADMLSAAHEADRERRAIIDQISPDWPEMARLLGGGFADRLGLGTFRAIARDLKNTDR